MSGNHLSRKALKVAMLGDSLVGKTSISSVFFGYNFDEHQLMTIGQVKMETKMKMEDGKELKFVIWDTAGQERFHAIAINACKSVQGIVVAFDLTKRETFDNVKHWLDEINENFNNIPVILFGNKCDMKEKRVVQKEEAEEFAKKYNLEYLETSAKENINIKEGIQKIANIAYKNSSSRHGFSLDEKNKNKPDGGCCLGGKKKKNNKK